MQIGEVAECTSLSLQTIRYYEEIGLVSPSAHTQGGFRLYTEADVERLRLVKRMKPLEFSMDEMRDLLRSAGPSSSPSPRQSSPAPGDPLTPPGSMDDARRRLTAAIPDRTRRGPLPARPHRAANRLT